MMSLFFVVIGYLYFKDTLEYIETIEAMADQSDVSVGHRFHACKTKAISVIVGSQ